MLRPRPASRGMRLSPIPREVGTCVSHDVAVWQRVRDGRQIREGRGQSHEGGSGLPRPRGGQGARGLPEPGAGMFSYDLATGGLAPVPEGAGGPKRRNARAAGTMLAVSLGDAFLLVSLLLCSGGMMACASSAGAARPAVSLSTLRGHPTPVAFPSRLSATTTARPARRSASPASYSATRACPSSSATSPATR